MYHTLIFIPSNKVIHQNIVFGSVLIGIFIAVIGAVAKVGSEEELLLVLAGVILSLILVLAFAVTVAGVRIEGSAAVALAGVALAIGVELSGVGGIVVTAAGIVAGGSILYTTIIKRMEFLISLKALKEQSQNPPK